ncbi:MAG: bifunctional glutamate N-acetyltransferase/amino-acid acetyltransferase ArgJ [Deltaproteobacteria bacterium]|nr:bifunctional glutamate N-acetyltransferase/amino-acid acetyltransferase ArgJ [Deltaproteobacteria bacterium]
MRIKGFKFASARSFQKKWERDDVALIYSEREAALAGMFTRNRFKAAPVELSMKRVERGRCRAVVVNAGCANACTGEEGLADAEATAEAAASALGVSPEDVLVASTGVIGARLNMKGMRDAMPVLAQGLSPDDLSKVSRAIMTTDTVPKLAFEETDVGGVQCTVAGVTKGAGMIRPNMATMLAFIMTDFKAAPELLAEMLRKAVDVSFHRVNIDGDTSTNDMVLLMANGAAGGPLLERGTTACRNAADAVTKVCADLAKQMVMDGEGATKFIDLRIKGAKNELEARQAAHLISESKLVKTAFFGEDANWGRILAALGRSEASFSPDEVDLFVGDICLVRNGKYQGKAAETDATKVLKNRAFAVTLDLKAGVAEYNVFTSDLSIDYVKINANYRT